MKWSTIVIVVLVLALATVSWSAWRQQEPRDENGRYQLVPFRTGSVFGTGLVDTQVGRIWIFAGGAFNKKTGDFQIGEDTRFIEVGVERLWGTYWLDATLKVRTLPSGVVDAMHAIEKEFEEFEQKE